MNQAIRIAMQAPKAPFGAVLVERRSGKIIACGYNRSEENPVYHGEIVAINNCAANHPEMEWSGLDLYSTAEPCPMCQSAIEWAGISNVYFGTSSDYLKSCGWKQIDIPAQEVADRTPFRKTNITGGILEQRCNVLFLAAR